jgi:(2R)-3-sulfolactate dehydrogenase (NADP+)
MAHLTLDAAYRLAFRALTAAGASEAMAASTAAALVRADAQGLTSHGLSRIPQYSAHLRNGRANGAAEPRIAKRREAVLLIDADGGLAFAACDMAIARGIEVARDMGVCFIGICNSHHCGVVVDHLRAVTEAGMVGLGFSNSPSAMPAAGGKHPVFGTNPIAAAFPRRSAQPLLIDMSLSEVARGKLMVAATAGQPIPQGWALDEHGQPTTDPQAGMDGSMLPIGAASSAKGAMLALVVELLVTALIGSHFGFEASSFFVDEGNVPHLGQSFILIDPGALAGSESYLDRVEVLIEEMLRDDGVRLPGARRLELEAAAQTGGINIPDALAQQINNMLA